MKAQPLIRSIVIGVALVAPACSGRDDAVVSAMTGGGRARHGSHVLEAYGCGSCHRIPGVARARGVVGPPLADIALRSYLAGRVPNDPIHMVQWIRHPHEIDPDTAMPDLGVSDSDARDMAAYLYTLR